MVNSITRGHVILLTLIYNLKSILTIKDIKKLLSPIFEGELEEKDEENEENIKRSNFCIMFIWN